MKKQTLVILLLSFIAIPSTAQGNNANEILPSELTYYTVPAMSNVKRLPDTFPEDGELGGTLQIVAAKNEFEPASFVVFSPENIDKAKLKVSKLTGKAGTIPAANVDLKVVKCWYQAGTAWYSYFADMTGREMVPELLLNDENLIKVDTDTKDNYLRVDYPEGTDYRWISNQSAVNVPFNAETTPVADAKKIQPFKLSAGEFKQFWVTVKVPADARSGIYRGSIKLSPGELSIPISVRVLPFELPKPMTNYDETREFYTIVYNSPSYLDVFRDNGADKKQADKKMLAVYKNMRDHNILNPIFPGVLREESHSRYQLKFHNTLARQLELVRDAGCSTDPLFGAIPGFPSIDWLESAKGVPLAEQKLSKAYTDIVEDSYNLVTKMFGHTNVYCFGWDEPAKWIVVSERLGWKYLHDKELKVFSTGTDHHLDFAGYNEDFINCPGDPSREQAAKWHAMGNRITNYAAPHIGPENPDFIRRVHGLQLFHANYDGIGNYAIRCRRWNDFLSSKYRHFSITYPTQDGVIDTIAWEGLREAIDDVRYATKLKQLARNAIATGKTENIYAGRQALQWLDLLDVKNADLNTTRLEMVNHILALSEFENKSTAPEPTAKKSSAQKGDPTVAKGLIAEGKKAKGELKGIKKWEAVLADNNISTEQHSKATFKLIESLAVKGKTDKASDTAQKAALDDKLSAGDKLTAKLICAGIAAGNDAGSLKAKADEAVDSFNQSDLGADVKRDAFNRAAKIFMVTRQYALVRELAAMADALYFDPPQEVYDVHYVKDAPSSVEGWVASDIVKDPKNREARFEPYDQKDAALLYLDVNSERDVGDDKVVADKGTSFCMAYDADGWSMFIDCKDSEAEKVTAGLVSGGSLEMFFAPGESECYYQWFVRPSGNSKGNTVQWSSPYRHYRSMDSRWKYDVDVIDNGIGVYVFIPWELVYDNLPAEGETWPFNIIRWSRAGGMTWRGKVHDIHNFGVVRWNGLTDETMIAIKRKIVLKAVAKYRKAKATAVDHWSDEVLGDPEFYKQKMVPAIEKLDKMTMKVSNTMTSEDITTLFEQAVPDWMEFKYLVSELRSEYLAKDLLTDSTP